MSGKTSQVPDIRILLVDDDLSYVRSLKATLETSYAQLAGLIDVATSTSEAQARLAETHYDIMILDIDFTDAGEASDAGIDFLESVKSVSPAMLVILTTGVADRATVFRGGKRGAFDFLEKRDVSDEDLLPTMNRALAHVLQQKRIQRLSGVVAQRDAVILLYRKVACTAAQLVLSVLLGIATVFLLSPLISGNLYRFGLFCLVMLFAAVFFEMLKRFAFKLGKFDLSASGVADETGGKGSSAKENRGTKEDTI
ncbi:MAG TPA: response regulator [Sedimentisphaerales bacterium]|nr:response regulator [Sedimentisphaerales bacterium]